MSKKKNPRLTDNIEFISEQKGWHGKEGVSYDEVTLSFLKELNSLQDKYDVEGVMLIASYKVPPSSNSYTYSVISLETPTEMLGILETLKQQIWADHYLYDEE